MRAGVCPVPPRSDGARGRARAQRGMEGAAGRAAALTASSKPHRHSTALSQSRCVHMRCLGCSAGVAPPGLRSRRDALRVAAARRRRCGPDAVTLGGRRAAAPQQLADATTAVEGLRALALDAASSEFADAISAAHPSMRASAANLAHYLALRRIDQRPLQSRWAYPAWATWRRTCCHTWMPCSPLCAPCLARRQCPSCQRTQAASFQRCCSTTRGRCLARCHSLARA